MHNHIYSTSFEYWGPPKGFGEQLENGIYFREKGNKDNIGEQGT